MPATAGVVLVSLSQADILPSGTHGNITIAYDQQDSGNAWENLQLNNQFGLQYSCGSIPKHGKEEIYSIGQNIVPYLGRCLALWYSGAGRDDMNSMRRRQRKRKLDILKQSRERTPMPRPVVFRSRKRYDRNLMKSISRKMRDEE